MLLTDWLRRVRSSRPASALRSVAARESQVAAVVQTLEERTLLAAVVYVNDDFTQPDGTVIADADPNTPGDQSATIGTDAFATIQAGIDAADDGGMVLVTDDLATDGPGFYSEAVSITGNLTLRSTENNRTAVVLDGGGVNRVVSIDGAVTVNIESLTMQNGNAVGGAGGGLSIINGAVVELTNLAVLDNTATSGGGIHIGTSGQVRVSRAVIRGNSATELGGGVYLDSNAGDVRLEFADVAYNEAGQQGGGIWNQSGGTLLIDVRSTILGNTALGNDTDDGGGGIYNDGTLVSR